MEIFLSVVTLKFNIQFYRLKAYDICYLLLLYATNFLPNLPVIRLQDKPYISLLIDLYYSTVLEFQ